LRDMVLLQLFDAVDQLEESKSGSFLRFRTRVPRFDADPTFIWRSCGAGWL
jgi:hypothetical protein